MADLGRLLCRLCDGRKASPVPAKPTQSEVYLKKIRDALVKK